MQHEMPTKPHTSTSAPIFVSSDIYKRTGFQGLHPLAISRIGAVEQFCRHLGWLGPDNYMTSSPAPKDILYRFHNRDYVDAIEQADKSGKISAETRERYNFGTMENPLFKGLFKRASTTIAGSIRAAEHALCGGIAFHPAGGTHHGRPDRASGFCYFNDPVFAILTLLNGGLSRIAYIDIDAHHGDGVEAAFADRPDILTFSIHEEKRWPHSGTQTGCNKNNKCNAPVPRGLHDSEFNYLIDQALMPLLDKFKPEALVIVCGADALAGDPLSAMNLSNQALWSAVKKLSKQYSKTVVLGGGGYNPWTTVRCWAGLWGVLADKPMPKTLPPKLTQTLQGFSSDLVDEEDVLEEWLTQLHDNPQQSQPIRPQIKQIAAQLRAR